MLCISRVDFLGDIHGDEEIEYNFLAGNEGIPAWDDRLRKLQDEFCSAFLHTSPDFQLGNGYGAAATCSDALRAGDGANALRMRTRHPRKLHHSCISMMLHAYTVLLQYMS